MIISSRRINVPSSAMLSDSTRPSSADCSRAITWFLLWECGSSQSFTWWPLAVPQRHGGPRHSRSSEGPLSTPLQGTRTEVERSRPETVAPPDRLQPAYQNILERSQGGGVGSGQRGSGEGGGAGHHGAP